VWLHVDAAWAGSAAILPEQRHWFQGLDQVDSYSFSVHK
jgi:glutamate/tyrosine decarboxylase-like PLP-dependent enzyme